MTTHLAKVLLLLSAFVFSIETTRADSLIQNIPTNITTPVPPGSCFAWAMASGSTYSDAKLCNNYLSALGAGPLATLALPGGTTTFLAGNGIFLVPPGSVNWPAGGCLVLSNATNSPNCFAPTNNAFAVGNGGVWTVLSNSGNAVPSWNSGVLSASSTLPSGLTIPGYLTGNQAITIGGDSSGAGATSITVTNLKVNGVTYPAAPPTNSVPAVTAPGVITYETGSALAALPGFGTMLTQNANAINVTGVTLLTGLPTCVNATDACPKNYIDAAASGQPPHNPVGVATAAVLPNTPTYNNGASGVGATLTSSTNTALVVDGTTVSTVGSGIGTTASRVLVNLQASGLQNGIFVLTQAGTPGSVPWILTRATDFNTAASGNIATGAAVFVTGGSTQASTSWSLSNIGAITVGTTALTFVQVGGAATYTADELTIHKTGTQFSALQNGILNAVTSTQNQLVYNQTGSAWGGIGVVNNAVMTTNGSGVPAESTTLPSGLTIPGYLTGLTSPGGGLAIGGSAPSLTINFSAIAAGNILANPTGSSAAPVSTILAAGNGVTVTDSTGPNTITIASSTSITDPAASASLTVAQWNACAGLIIEASGQTLTLPAFSTVSSNANGCFWLQTIGLPTTLTPSGGDVIKVGTGLGVNASVTIPANAQATVVTINSSGWVVPLGPMQHIPLSWGANLNLAAPTVGISIGNIDAARTVYAIKCRPDVLVGGVATLDVYIAPSGTAFNAGTKLNTTSCNANTGVGAEQNMGVTTASIPANSWIGIVAAGAGWGASVGWGALDIGVR